MQWEDLHGASVELALNDDRLVDVPFFAESRCTGANAGRCVMRIIATSPDFETRELNPAAGVDYAFDTDMPGNVDPDGWEGQGLERSDRLEGDTTWGIQVQYAVTNAATQFTLDDWHLAVITNQ